MADAEIIDFVSRESSGPGGRRSPGAGPQTEPDDPGVGEPGASSPSENLVGLLSDLVHLTGQGLATLRSIPIRALQTLSSDPLRAAMTAAQSLGVAWPISVDEAIAFARARLSGSYSIDDFGFDPEFTEQIFLPLLRPLVQSWFRLDVRGARALRHLHSHRRLRRTLVLRTRRRASGHGLCQRPGSQRSAHPLRRD